MRGGHLDCTILGALQVDAEGNITLTGKGVTVISVETAETDNYLESKASFTLFVIEGEGTFEAPYTPADVQYFNAKACTKA